MGKSVAIIGATGATGKFVLETLLNEEEIETIVVISRRPLNLSRKKIKEYVINLEDIANLEIDIRIDNAYCCLGTTIKKAKSIESFRKVDVNYPLSFAKWCKIHHCSNFNIISAISANPKSKHYYSKAKGDVELALIDLDFKTLNIYRPSLLTGEREEFRMVEKASSYLFKALDLILFGPLAKYQSISTKFLGSSIVKQSLINNLGVHTLYKPDLEKLD